MSRSSSRFTNSRAPSSKRPIFRGGIAISRPVFGRDGKPATLRRGRCGDSAFNQGFRTVAVILERPIDADAKTFHGRSQRPRPRIGSCPARRRAAELLAGGDVSPAPTAERCVRCRRVRCRGRATRDRCRTTVRAASSNTRDDFRDSGERIQKPSQAPSRVMGLAVARPHAARAPCRWRLSSRLQYDGAPHNNQCCSASSMHGTHAVVACQTTEAGRSVSVFGRRLGDGAARRRRAGPSSGRLALAIFPRKGRASPGNPNRLQGGKALQRPRVMAWHDARGL